nr:TetR/AcrR family transcriptional regulator [Nesterenkonia xinjiangensis]
MIDQGRPVTVSAVVEASGVSRSALYRRWPGMTELIAAALDRGRATIELDIDGDIREAIMSIMFGDPAAALGPSYSERRFRARMALVMQNPDVQQAYWKAHVRRRRAAFHRALSEAVRRGDLRSDLDLEACIDLINGVFYYQVVVRGARMDHPEVAARCCEAFDVAWRGMITG